jgi:hypothetical protein
MATRKKMGSTADYIIPLVVLGAIGLGGYYVYQKLFGSSPGPALPGPAASSPVGQSVQTAFTGLAAYLKARETAGAASDCFTSYLYKADPSNASIDQATAQALYANIHAAAGGWFTHGNFQGILEDFQAVVGNQTDISFVALMFEQQDGKDMLNYILNTSTFGNNSNPDGNNYALVWAFVQWAISLPLD